ncbi:uncharacterized protein PG998_011791, partial [Apiospora kogelbergensis]|uniref:uncharacterized protein n=1 Tax=Apiospora kogelbergensis TaxID=1337665 RepID=UPI00312EB6E6
MRLIDVDSFHINDFIGDEIPPYAILSHTWGLDEVTLKDMQAEFGGGEEEHHPSRGPLRKRADIRFFNAQWTFIGTRNDGLRRALAFATGIDYKCLGSGDHARLEDYSIATRMSWASHRSCTRTEDVAYCLMGIFNINMPMLYGEGKKAFIRLQEEILKEIEDHSLFAWSVAEDSDRAWCPSSIFAESPADFARSGDIKPLPISRYGLSSITKLGLSIRLGESTIREPTRKEP